MKKTFQLFKHRGFSEVFNDTFNFIKQYGKNFFSIFIKIFAFPMLFLLLCMYLMYDNLMILSGMSSSPDVFFENNVFSFLGSLGIFMFVFGLLYLFLFAYPQIYFEEYAKLDHLSQKEVSFQAVVNGFKKHWKRIVLFGIFSLFVFGIILSIASVIAAFLVFIIIGIPLLMLLIPIALLWMYLSFSEYVIRRRDYFESISFAFQYLTNRFWHYVGSLLVIMILIYIVNSIFTMVPYMIYFFQLFSSTSVEQNLEMNSFTIFLTIIYIISIFVGIFTSNIIYISSSLIYYSEREQLENRNSQYDLQEIGQHHE